MAAEVVDSTEMFEISGEGSEDSEKPNEDENGAAGQGAEFDESSRNAVSSGESSPDTGSRKDKEDYYQDSSDYGASSHHPNAVAKAGSVDEESKEKTQNTRGVHNSILKAGKDITIAETINILQESADSAIFEEVPEKSILLDKQLFVRPRSFPEASLTLRLRDIWLLNGPEHSGKRIAAVNLAAQLREVSKRSIYYYVRSENSTLSLLEVFRHEESPKDAIVIAEDVFERNVHRRELSAANLDSLLTLLSEARCYLILTASAESEFLESLDSHRMGVINTRQERRDLIYQMHIDVLLGEEGLQRRPVLCKNLQRVWPALESLLGTGFHIRRFIDKVSSHAEDLPNTQKRLDAALKRLAEQVAHIGSSALRQWFGELKNNDKVFGLMAYLFEGHDFIWIESVYQKAVEAARADGWDWLHDPRGMGMVSSLESIQCEIHARRLQFIEKAYRLECKREVENYITFSCFLLEFLVREISSDSTDWAAPWRRHCLGRALARIGIHRQEWYNAQLDCLARERERKLAVIPGYSLQEAIHIDSSGSAGFIIKTLERWIRSKDPYLIWAAGAAIPKLYVRLYDDDTTAKFGGIDYPGRLLRLIIELSRHAGDLEENEDARQRKETNLWLASRDLCEVFIRDPLRVTELIEECLSNAHADIQLAARRGVGLIFESFARKGEVPTAGLLPVITSLLGATLNHIGIETDDFQKIFLTLRGWTCAEEVCSAIKPFFIGIASYSSEDVRKKLCAGLVRFWLCSHPDVADRLARKICHKEPDYRRKILLDFWLCQPRDPVLGLARDVISRAYTTSGVLLDPPELGHGVVIVDPLLFETEEKPSSLKDNDELERKQSTEQDRKNAFLWNLLIALEAHIDVSLVYAGGDLVLLSEADIERSRRRFSFSSPLVMPGAEATGILRPSVTLIVTGRNFPDMGDLLSSSWASNLFLVHSGKVDVAFPGERCIEVSWPPKDRDWVKIEENMTHHWARQIAFLSPEDWLPATSALGIDLKDGTAVEDLLAVCLEQFADHEATYEVDPARKVLATVLWWAAQDLESCLNLLHRWLVPREDDPLAVMRAAIAAAASRALLRVHSAYEPQDGLCAPTRLFAELAGPLAARSMDDLKFVLNFIRHWMAEPVWTVFLGGGVLEGKGRLHQWADPFISQECPGLQKTLAEFASLARPEPISSAWEFLQATVDRLLVRIALTSPSNLLSIRPNERYFVILLDTRDNGPEARLRIDKTAKEFCRQALEEPERAWVPIIYRMGERHPCWGEGAELPGNLRFLPQDVELPALVGPILSSPELDVGRVAAVLILTGGLVLDLDDWKETPWAEKIVVHSFDKESLHCPIFASRPEWASNLSDYFPT